MTLKCVNTSRTWMINSKLLATTDEGRKMGQMMHLVQLIRRMLIEDDRMIAKPTNGLYGCLHWLLVLPMACCGLGKSSTNQQLQASPIPNLIY